MRTQRDACALLFLFLQQIIRHWEHEVFGLRSHYYFGSWEEWLTTFFFFFPFYAHILRIPCCKGPVWLRRMLVSPRTVIYPIQTTERARWIERRGSNVVTQTCNREGEPEITTPSSLVVLHGLVCVCTHRDFPFPNSHNYQPKNSQWPLDLNMQNRYHTLKHYAFHWLTSPIIPAKTTPNFALPLITDDLRKQ